ncbi:MAG: hypothetical protein QGF00_19905 [Planctomycetota bacterium]|nr:hypothetical protein [Planctomycetota bacterium]MDP7251884.1 hypothetical protein [Planctomycetota bacterium]
MVIETLAHVCLPFEYGKDEPFLPFEQAPRRIVDRKVSAIPAELRDGQWHFQRDVLVGCNVKWQIAPRHGLLENILNLVLDPQSPQARQPGIVFLLEAQRRCDGFALPEDRRRLRFRDGHRRSSDGLLGPLLGDQRVNVFAVGHVAPTPARDDCVSGYHIHIRRRQPDAGEA